MATIHEALAIVVQDTALHKINAALEALAVVDTTDQLATDRARHRVIDTIDGVVDERLVHDSLRPWLHLLVDVIEDAEDLDAADFQRISDAQWQVTKRHLRQQRDAENPQVFADTVWGLGTRRW